MTEEDRAQYSVGQASALDALDKATAGLNKTVLAMDAVENITTLATIRVSPGKDPAVLKLADECLKLFEYARTRAIASLDDIKAATNDLSMLANLKKAIEEKRKEYTAPINEHLKAIKAAFDMVSAPVEQADKITRDKILAYKQEQERKARDADEINRLRLEAAKKEMELKGEITESVNLIEQPAKPPAHVYADLGSLGTQKVWKFELVDFTLLPNEYKLADMVKIGKIVRAGVAVPGVRAWQEESLRVNTK